MLFFPISFRMSGAINVASESTTPRASRQRHERLDNVIRPQPFVNNSQRASQPNKRILTSNSVLQQCLLSCKTSPRFPATSQQQPRQQQSLQHLVSGAAAASTGTTACCNQQQRLRPHRSSFHSRRRPLQQNNKSTRHLQLDNTLEPLDQCIRIQSFMRTS